MSPVRRLLLLLLLCSLFGHPAGVPARGRRAVNLQEARISVSYRLALEKALGKLRIWLASNHYPPIKELEEDVAQFNLALVGHLALRGAGRGGRRPPLHFGSHARVQAPQGVLWGCLGLSSLLGGLGARLVEGSHTSSDLECHCGVCLPPRFYEFHRHCCARLDIHGRRVFDIFRWPPQARGMVCTLPPFSRRASASLPWYYLYGPVRYIEREEQTGLWAYTNSDCRVRAGHSLVDLALRGDASGGTILTRGYGKVPEYF